MTRTVTVVTNPIAGRGRAGRLVSRVVAGLEARGLAVDLLAGRDRDDALDLCHIAVASRTSALVALGGDGTVHLALQAVAGHDIALGILPAGTGNDFACCLGVRADLDAAMDVIAGGVVRAVDAVRAVGPDGRRRWWGCVMGAGFDSAVNERANRMRWPRGPRRYDVAIVAELARLRPRPFVVDVDGSREELLATFVAVGNAPMYGGGMRIAPAADLADGLLDVTVVGPVSRTEMIRMKPRVYTGEHVAHPAVSTRRGRVVRLAADGVTAYADGERLADLPVTSECVAGALNVLAPEARP